MSLFFDEVVLMQFARKRFLHERLLYLPERLRKFLSPIRYTYKEIAVPLYRVEPLYGAVLIQRSTHTALATTSL